MSRPSAFPGSVLATKAGEADKNIRAGMADTYRQLGWTVAGSAYSGVPTFKAPASIVTCSYGASWTLDWLSTVDWHSVVRARRGYGTHTDRGQQGAGSQRVMEIVCGSYVSGDVRFWTPGDADIVFLQTGVGIDQFYDSSDGRSPLGAYDALTMQLATLEGGARTEVTTGGAWTNSSADYAFSGGAGSSGGTGTWRSTTTAGALIPISIVGPAVDIAISTCNGTSNGLSADTYGRPCDVYVDGVFHSTWDTDNRVSLEAPHDLGHRMVRLRNLGEGAHTVELVAGSHAQAAAFLAVDYFVYPLDEPPIIVALKEMLLNEYTTDPALQADWDAVFGAFDDAVADHRIANPHSRLVIADLSGGWPDEARMQASDGLHPTQLGHDWMADVADRALLAVGPVVFT